MKLLVSGLLNIETTAAVRGFPIHYYPIDYPFFGVNSAVSGVGYNLAKALTTLSDEVQLLSFIGNDDEGDRIMTQLHRDGIDADKIARTLKSTPTSVVLYDPEGKRQIYCDLKDIQEQRIAPDSVSLDSCAIAAICNINFNRDLIKAAHDSGILTATDVHVLSDIEDDYNRDFMENADILFLSDEALPCEPQEFLSIPSARAMRCSRRSCISPPRGSPLSTPSCGRRYSRRSKSVQTARPRASAPKTRSKAV